MEQLMVRRCDSKASLEVRTRCIQPARTALLDCTLAASTRELRHRARQHKDHEHPPLTTCDGMARVACAARVQHRVALPQRVSIPASGLPSSSER